MGGVKFYPRLPLPKKHKPVKITEAQHNEDMEHLGELVINKIRYLVKTGGIHRTYNFWDFLSAPAGVHYVPHRNYFIQEIMNVFNELVKEGKLKFINIPQDVNDYLFDLTYRITENFTKPRLISFVRQKEYVLQEKLVSNYPKVYKLLTQAQLKLAHDKVKSTEIAQAALLLVDFWETWSDQLWKEYPCSQDKPPKDKTILKLNRFFNDLYTKDERDLGNAMLQTFHQLANMVQRVKHRNKESTLKNARNALLLTVMVASDLTERLDRAKPR